MGNHINNCCNIKEPEKGNVDLLLEGEFDQSKKRGSRLVEVVDHDGKKIIK